MISNILEQVKMKKEYKTPKINQIINYLFPLILQQHKGLIVVSLLALLAEIGVIIIEPWFLKFIFDEIISKEFQIQNLQVSFLDNLDVISLLSLSLIAVVIIALLRAITAYLNTTRMTVTAIRVMNEIRANLYSHIQNLSFASGNKPNTQNSIASVIYDIKRLRKVILVTVLPLLTKILTTIAILAVMMWLNIQLAMMAIVIFLLFLITKKYQKSLKENQQTPNFKKIQFHTVKLLIAVPMALILGRGVELVIEGTLTPGDLLVFVTYLKVAFKPMEQWEKYGEKIADAILSCKRITNFLEIAPKVGAS